MRSYYLYFTVAILSFVSCSEITVEGLGIYGTWENENIDEEIRSEIASLDRQIVKALINNQPNVVLGMMSDTLVWSLDEKFKPLVEQASYVFKDSEFESLNKFYVKNSDVGKSNTVFSGLSGTQDYIIRYKSLNKEMFISLLIQKDEKSQFVIANIYGKYPQGWKLNIMQFGQYTIQGNNAVDLFLAAKSNYQKGHLIDAANEMFLSSQISKPANEYWQYLKEEEMRGFFEQLRMELKEEYEFPVSISQVPSQPQIFNIYPMDMNEGYFPVVEYLTRIELEDTASTKAENDQVHALIGHLFNGIDQDKKYIVYKAYNRFPDGKTQIPSYGFVKDLE